MNIKLKAGEDFTIITKNNHTVTVPDADGTLYIKPVSGIPESDLTSDVQTILNRSKTESFTNQEFIYRKSPKTLDVNTFNLDRIYGKTLAWNQLQPGFDDTVTVNNITQSGTGDGKITVTVNNASGYNQIQLPYISYIAGHVYIVKGWDYTTDKIEIYNTSVFPGSSNSEPYIGVAQLSGQHSLAMYVPQSLPNGTYYYYPQVFDLTLMFGAGNEPTTVAEFEAMFPEPYYPYNPGELISNDAKALETVGFNLWDEEWEIGYYDASGIRIEQVGEICTKNFIPVFPNTEYYFGTPQAYQTRGNICYYDENRSIIRREDSTALFTTPSNARFIQLSFGQQYGGTYNHDICINLSNPSKNGIYEPYTKSYLPLNLSSLKVKSPNIWDEEWENGLINSQTGSLDTSSANSRTKNYISVVGGQTYYFKAPYNLYTRLYNAKKEYLGQGSTVANTTYQIPECVSYIKFVTDYGSITIGDICINESNPGWNGNYYPHGTFNPFPDGLRSTDNDTYDEIIGTKVIRRIKKSVGSEFTLHNTSSANYKTYKTTLTDGYNQSTPVQHWVDNFGINYNGVLNSEIVSVETVQYDGDSTKIFYVSVAPGRNIDNFVLYYKLAIPEEFELDVPIALAGIAGTTERRLPEDTSSSVLAPFACDITYGTNNEEILDVVDAKIGQALGDVEAILATI